MEKKYCTASKFGTLRSVGNLRINLSKAALRLAVPSSPSQLEARDFAQLPSAAVLALGACSRLPNDIPRAFACLRHALAVLVSSVTRQHGNPYLLRQRSQLKAFELRKAVWENHPKMSDERMGQILDWNHGSFHYVE